MKLYISLKDQTLIHLERVVDGQVKAVALAPSVQKEVQKWLDRGFLEWVQDEEAEDPTYKVPRVTPISDPEFLPRIAAHVRITHPTFSVVLEP